MYRTAVLIQQVITASAVETDITPARLGGDAACARVLSVTGNTVSDEPALTLSGYNACVFLCIDRFS